MNIKLKKLQFVDCKNVYCLFHNLFLKKFNLRFIAYSNGKTTLIRLVDN